MCPGTGKSTWKKFYEAKVPEGSSFLFIQKNSLRKELSL
jgi:hypothetical protein